MIVMKFGGTSVQDAPAIRNVISIVEKQRDETPLVVVSACAGVTNALIDLASLSRDGKVNEAISKVITLRERHVAIASELLNRRLADVVRIIDHQFKELEQLIKGVSILRDLTPRALDQFASYGERWLSLIIANAFLEKGHWADWFDARKVIITDNEFTKAAPLFDLIAEKAKKELSPFLGGGSIVITQGFIGSTIDGITTTLGRGGSDYSAAIFGAALSAEEIQIWTDVDGILTADPSVLPEAKPIPQMTFDEASELAYFGAKVLHPSTILPAVKKDIPVRVLNSKHPEAEGTLITANVAGPAECAIKSIAYKEHITVLTLQSTRMLMAPGFLANIFNIFQKYKKSIDVVATSEVGVSLTIDDDADLDNIVEELSRFAEVSIEKNRCVFCVVGHNMKRTKGIAGRVFNTLSEARVNVELISHGGSEINLTFVVSEEQIETAVKCLHDEFFPAEASGHGFLNFGKVALG